MKTVKAFYKKMLYCCRFASLANLYFELPNKYVKQLLQIQVTAVVITSLGTPAFDWNTS